MKTYKLDIPFTLFQRTHIEAKSIAEAKLKARKILDSKLHAYFETLDDTSEMSGGMAYLSSDDFENEIIKLEP